MNDTERNFPDEPKRAIIFANAQVPSEPFIRDYMQDNDLLICADGGANRIADYDILPHVIIGDMDSVSVETMDTMLNVQVVRLPEQENTDLEKALLYAEKHGVERAIVFGATGGRPDHFLGNLSLLKEFKGRVDIQLIDEWCTILLVRDSVIIRGEPGQTVSLWPISGSAEGVITAGLKYPLDNEILKQSSRGISNEMYSDTATIKVSKGHLVVIVFHPDSEDYTEFEPMIKPIKP